MREYELTVLIHPDLEADLEKPLQTVRDIVTTNGGTDVSEDNWGKKRLAYTIAKENFAVYVQLLVQLPPAAVGKIDSVVNITDSVLRHLIAGVDAKAKAAAAEAASKSESSDKSAKEEE